MSLALRALLAITLLLAACHRGPRAPRFAVEVPAAAGAPPARVVVDEGLGSDSNFPLTSLAYAGGGSESLAGWETLALNYTAGGDGVKVTVFAVHQEYDARRHATLFRSQKLGAHTAHVRETVQLGELSKYGYTPLTLRVVPAK